MEEVRGHQACRLGAQERAPIGGPAPGRGADTGSSEDTADRACTDAVPEPDQLSLDTAMPPTRVLPGKPDDQLTTRHRPLVVQAGWDRSISE